MPRPKAQLDPTALVRPVGFRVQPPRVQASGATPPVASAARGGPSDKTTCSPAPPSTAMTPRNAPPMKKRNKGSGFLGFLFLAAVGSLGFFAWSSLLQYRSFGVVQGRIVEVAAPWDGTISSWQVRDGDLVEQGQILATLSNLNMEHELATLRDELTLSQSELEAKISQLKFESRNQSERNQKALAEYLEAYGELLSEQTALEALERKFKRARRLVQDQSISTAEYEQILFELTGQQKKLEQLEDAVAVLKLRSVESTHIETDEEAQLRPIVAKISVTRQQIKRLRERISQGEIQAPMSGRVVKRSSLTGEAIRNGEPLLEILEDNSVEAVMYLSQKMIDDLKIGQTVDVLIEPESTPYRCEVVRFENQLKPAPATIARFYREKQALLPVHLRPTAYGQQVFSLRIGATVKLPYDYSGAANKLAGEFSTEFQKLRSKFKREEAEPTVHPTQPSEQEPATRQVGFSQSPTVEEQRTGDQLMPKRATAVVEANEPRALKQQVRSRESGSARTCSEMQQGRGVATESSSIEPVTQVPADSETMSADGSSHAGTPFSEFEKLERLAEPALIAPTGPTQSTVASTSSQPTSQPTTEPTTQPTRPSSISRPPETIVTPDLGQRRFGYPMPRKSRTESHPKIKSREHDHG